MNSRFHCFSVVSGPSLHFFFFVSRQRKRKRNKEKENAKDWRLILASMCCEFSYEDGELFQEPGIHFRPKGAQTEAKSVSGFGANQFTLPFQCHIRSAG